MWWVKDHPNHSRGGFQNRDVGKSDYDEDLGPWYGVDYARFSDPPDLVKDQALQERLMRTLGKEFHEEMAFVEISVRNGFVILKGVVSNRALRSELISKTLLQEGVREVINQLRLSNLT